jgi:hypothetical protein
MEGHRPGRSSVIETTSVMVMPHGADQPPDARVADFKTPA